MLFKMSDDKKTIVEPTVIFAASQPTSDENGPKKSGITKKHVVVAVVALLVTGLVVTGALVGMKIYTDSNLEIVKYTMNANGLSQNVSVDNNVVSYHVLKDGIEAWIVQDFDKNIQVTKRLADGSTNCFVTALNRSLAPDASSIPDTTPDTTGANTVSVAYSILPDLITDLSFLGKKASAMCQNVPTYHAVPDCSRPDANNVLVDNSTLGHRSKRTPAFCATCNAPRCSCICGCCTIWCADYSQGGTVCTYSTTRTCTSSGCYYTYICTFYYRALYAIYTLQPSCAYYGRTYLP